MFSKPSWFEELIYKNPHDTEIYSSHFLFLLHHQTDCSLKAILCLKHILTVKDADLLLLGFLR